MKSQKRERGEGGKGGRGTKEGSETPLVVCGTKTNVSKATFST